jgi:uncharacterized YigZ family protein
MLDQFNTISAASEGFYKEKGSKFIGYAYPITSEEEVKPIIDQLKKDHNQARHWCFAYRLSPDGSNYRANDDGEPSNSAGAPILGQLQSFEVTNCLIVVVRYFGGTKLGVGGLITAYKSAAQIALEEATIVEAFVNQHFLFTFSYDQTSDINRFISEHNAKIINQTFDMNCTMEVGIRLTFADQFYEQAKQLFGITVEKL